MKEGEKENSKIIQRLHGLCACHLFHGAFSNLYGSTNAGLMKEK